MASTSRPTYTANQLHQYLKYIQYPDYGDSSTLPQPTLENLRILIIHQLSTIPFENLSLHYTTDSSPHVFTEPEAIFQKIVTNQKGRGGYCMELNTFFGTVLRGLGYRVRSVGARVSDGSIFDGETESVVLGGWTHIVNIVTITQTDYHSQKYMVDVSFGIDVPTIPLSLVPDVERPSLPGWSVRLQHKPLDPSDADDDTQKLWWTQHRATAEPNSKWTTSYVFTELEFLPADIRVMNYYTSHYRACFFTFRLVVMAFSWSDVEDKVEVNAKLKAEAKDKDKAEKTRTTRHLTGVKWVISNSYTERQRSTKQRRILETEEDRIKCLREQMGIVISDQEAASIKGTAASIA